MPLTCICHCVKTKHRQQYGEKYSGSCRGCDLCGRFMTIDEAHAGAFASGDQLVLLGGVGFEGFALYEVGISRGREWPVAINYNLIDRHAFVTPDQARDLAELLERAANVADADVTPSGIAGVCSLCGCTEARPCVDRDPDGPPFDVCAWTNARQTLCSSCIEKEIEAAR